MLQICNFTKKYLFLLFVVISLADVAVLTQVTERNLPKHGIFYLHLLSKGEENCIGIATSWVSYSSLNFLGFLC